ncbi:MAG TPA: oligopeptide/dipeptide ABC transporter ATP-binding protein [Gemmatimonadales bacterium]|nr:oligopeptide/dipeptide ABC transporter ATP-binding protein [Gemmatimonadales bacterium]
MTALLEVRDLVKRFDGGGLLRGGRGTIHAVNGVSFDLAPGETLGVVGESGSGKSTVGRAVLRLTEKTSGEVRFDGVDVYQLPGRELRTLRRRMQIVFQDPYSSLDPRVKAGGAVAEGLQIHRLLPRAEIPGRVAELLQEVGLDPSFAEKFPHECSGGQRQRIGIARALAVDPAFLVCDEPVSALDVSVQAQVLNLLADLQRRRGIAFLFIAHDLAVVRQLAHRIAVMYFGRIVELAPTDPLIRSPRHPYTQALLSAVPEPDPGRQRSRIVLRGDPPRPTQLPPGCPFASRCFHPMKDARCVSERPLLRVVGESEVACHYAEHNSLQPSAISHQSPTPNS